MDNLVSVSVPPSATSSMPGSERDDDGGECRLLGSFSVLVQLILGALALLSLVYKRWRERPQRPIKVWAFDVSKQVFGSFLMHLANLLASLFSAGQMPIGTTYQPNPCSYYLLNLGIDVSFNSRIFRICLTDLKTTLGIPILILMLRILNHAAEFSPLANPPESIESGNYGNPPRYIWWLKQSIIYFCGLMCMKICVVFLIQIFPFIVKVGDWALRWTEGNAAIQIFFVMFLFPVIMNALQYYIIDTFIKKPIIGERGSIPADDIFDADDEWNRRRGPLTFRNSYGHDSDSQAEQSVVFSDEEATKRNLPIFPHYIGSPSNSLPSPH